MTEENMNEELNADKIAGVVKVKPTGGKLCPICNKVLPPETNMSFHKMLHPCTEKPYSCNFCLFVSMTKEELTEHCKEIHPEKRKFVCKVCDRVFSNIRSLNKHKPAHAPKLPYHCAYCDRGFQEYVSWRLHEVGHKTGRYECNECEVRFTTMKTFSSHLEREVCKINVFECCEQTFQARIEYVEHCLSKHRQNAQKNEYVCGFCGRHYAFQNTLNTHQKRCRLRTKTTCVDEQQASVNAITGDSSEQSVVTKTATRISVIKEQNKNCSTQQYECDKCDRKFQTKFWLEQHQKKHVNGTIKKKYQPYVSLNYHKQVKQVHRFKCSQCEKFFLSNQSLRDHMTSHTGEQPYECEYCGKRFRHRASRNDHLRVHTGENPYPCRYCDLSFNRRFTRVKHERRHTGEKPYQCRVCDQRFTQDSTWRSHEKRHKEPFFCNICDLELEDLDLLVSHKEGHKQLEEIVPSEIECKNDFLYVQFEVN